MVNAQAPAMTPAPGLSWQSVLVDAKVHVARSPSPTPPAPCASATSPPAARGFNAWMPMSAAMPARSRSRRRPTSLAIPGPKPDLLAGTPLTVDASAQLAAPDRPVTFAIRHKLLTLNGTAQTEGVQKAQVHLVAA